jgi:RHS repeat-associated protein
MNDGSSHIQYLLKDHQGSLAEVAGSDGQVTESYSFDAFGRRRNAQSWTMQNLPATYSIDRGYTFHEHLDAFELINMNGRMYDPLVARFLSPDPFIQNPEYSQSYNRYSYVFNNPLRFVDPSGYFAEGDSTGGYNLPIPNLFPKAPHRIPEIYETNTDVAQGEIFVLKYEGKEDHSRNRTRAGETMAQTGLLSARASRFPPAALFVLGSGSFLASYYFLMDNFAGDGNANYPGPWYTDRPKNYIPSPPNGFNNRNYFPEGNGNDFIKWIIRLGGGSVLGKRLYDGFNYPHYIVPADKTDLINPPQPFHTPIPDPNRP